MPGSGDLVDCLVGARPAPTAGEAARVQQALSELAGAGQAAWPALPLAPLRLARYLARHLADTPPDTPMVEWVRSLRAGDVHLACACAERIPGAVEALERSYLSRLPVWLARLRRDPAFVDEVGQSLRERLLVGHAGQELRIASYGGRGSLESWLRVSAVRLAIDLGRQPQVHLVNAIPAVDEVFAEPAPSADLEAAYLQNRYRTAFAEAYAEAVRSLTSEQRNLLTLHFVDGLTLDQLATVLRVHRATGARWIAAARSAILGHAGRLLRERLGVSPSELESLTRLMRGDLDLSIVTLLRDSKGT